MRGLEIRSTYAAALLACTVHDVKGMPPSNFDAPFYKYEGTCFDAMIDAKAMGYQEYSEGVTDAPILFRSIPALTGAWNQGQSLRAVFEDCAQCSYCNDQTYLLCPIHG